MCSFWFLGLSESSVISETKSGTVCSLVCKSVCWCARFSVATFSVIFTTLQSFPNNFHSLPNWTWQNGLELTSKCAGQVPITMNAVLILINTKYMTFPSQLLAEGVGRWLRVSSRSLYWDGHPIEKLCIERQRWVRWWGEGASHHNSRGVSPEHPFVTVRHWLFPLLGVDDRVCSSLSQVQILWAQVCRVIYICLDIWIL